MLKKGVAVPYTLPLPTEETNWKVGYESPSDITLVGSWSNKMSVKPKDGLRYSVDLAVEMPDVSWAGFLIGVCGAEYRFL
jgi:U3 small nucleolar RNA-associated protein 22